jgi:hypothetical protein
MRKLFAVLLVLFGCLTFVGQAVASASAGYSDCCLQGCKGMVHCASATCQACAAPQPAPAPQAMEAQPADEPHWPFTTMSFDAGPRREPWNPPD